MSHHVLPRLPGALPPCGAIDKAWIRMALLLAGLLAGSSAPAQDNDLAALFGNEENVSIATGSNKPLRLAPAVASVLTADDIRAAGATRLDEVLALVPGFHVAQSPINRLNPNWAIRGIMTDQTPQVLLLRDGIPLTYAYNGARPNLFQLPVEHIERVEVIRGPGSAIYGADAYAGVVNVITRSADSLQGLASGVRLGSVERRDAWLQYGQPLGDWRLGVSLEYGHQGDDPDRRISSDLQSVFDNIFATSASHAPGAMNNRYDVLNADVKLQRGPLSLALWHWRQWDAGVGAGAANALDPTGRQDTEFTRFDLSQRFAEQSEGWRSELRFTYHDHNDHPKFVLFPAGATLPVGSDGNIASSPSGGVVTFTDGVIGQPTGRERFALLEMATYYSGLDKHQWRASLGLRYERIDSSELKNFGPGILDGSEGTVSGSLTDVSNTAHVFMPDQQRSVRYVSLQDEWNFAPDWELTGGLRHDHYSDFGDTLNPRLALVWSTRHDLTSKLMVGRAFRAPSFGEQHVQNNPVLLGNANLQPETIVSYDLAFDYRPSETLTSKLNLFRYDIHDLIDYLPDGSGTTFTAQNAHDRDGQGLELELSWRPRPNLHLSASYAWQSSRDSASHQPIANTPAHLANLQLQWQLTTDWSLQSHGLWVADQKRASADPRPPVKDYLLTALSLRHSPAGRHWQMALGIDNLFNHNARVPSLYNPALGTAAVPDDYPLPGRHLWLEFRYLP